MMKNTEGWTLELTVGPDPHLNQGDLIFFRERSDPLKSAGVVVTADCDLKNRKHAQLVTLVPIVSIKTAMEYYLLLEACEKQREKILEFSYRENNFDKEIDPVVVDVLMRDLSGKIFEETPQKIAIEFLLRRQEFMTVKQYSILMSAIGSKPKGVDSFEKQIENKGDIVVLPSADFLGVKGGLAWVRHIWQEPVGKIALKTSDTKHCEGEKVARLNSPYRYRLTQVMAQVFSDIGLPDSDRSFNSEIQEVLSNA